MNGRRKEENDEILYLDEIRDEVSRPLTSIESESVPPFIDLRAGFVPENNGDLANNSRRPSFVETEVEQDGKLDGKPHMPIGFDSRIGPEVLAEPQPSWPSDVLPSPTVQVVTPDVNIYQHKKTLAQGMMDLALLSANANQMRYVLQTDGRHPYFFPSLTMIGLSLFLQIAVGIGLIWNSVYNVKEHEQMCKANKANNWTVIGIFLVTILNVFISSFGVVDQGTVVTT
ncbi:uncharacterized protein LOC105425983 [Pogonomyrmex barbatus]|uniref:Uncharacterized protein LOC105425983 n=1 Tax=Pogonomyrmex barbatus TaxID=144034 RepID=A0A6I9W2F5_9HYME|nr:uncharacterized protein LOC105425983 [Pogonomyrmex barbatus]